MCCCATPNTNGTLGYSWDGKSIGTCPIDAPALDERDILLFDEPGRCGGMDSHCHHYRLVKKTGTELLVKHGGGEERIRVSLPRGFSLEAMDSNTRYWLLNAIYHAHSDGKHTGIDSEARRYTKAFLEGRLRKRKSPGRNYHRVWIDS